MRAAVRASLADLEPGRRVVVALSGGPDSLALAAAAVVVCAEMGLLCEAVVVDHQLQAGSGEVASRAAGQARILGCQRASVVPVEVDAGPGSGGPEAAARVARYRALEAAAAGPAGQPAAVVLLGHTRDDQAETVLLGLTRGSGTRSLAGMAPRRGCHRRPLLDLPREVVAAAAWEQAADDPRLTPWADPHNEDAAFTRVRIRREALPVLEEVLGPGVAGALARTAELARADADALDLWAEQVGAHIPREAAAPRDPAPSRTGPSGPARVARLGPVPPDLDPVPRAVLHRVVRRFLVDAGSPPGALNAGHVADAAALLAGTASARAELALPGGGRARREAGALVVRT